MAKTTKKKAATKQAAVGAADPVKDPALKLAGAKAKKLAKPKALAKPKTPAKPKKRGKTLVRAQIHAGLATPAGQPHSASGAAVLDRLWSVVLSRREANPALSHSARLLSRGTAKVAQKFGEEAVEALIEAVAGNREALIGESADVLYHLLVLWVASDISPDDVWAELRRREGVSGIAEKAARALPAKLRPRTSKIP